MVFDQVLYRFIEKVQEVELFMVENIVKQRVIWKKKHYLKICNNVDNIFFLIIIYYTSSVKGWRDIDVTPPGGVDKQVCACDN